MIVTTMKLPGTTFHADIMSELVSTAPLLCADMQTIPYIYVHVNLYLYMYIYIYI